MLRLIDSITPRGWQRTALHEWSKNQRGIAAVVTGGGKTVFAFLCIERFLHDNPDGRVVIVVPTLSLLDQWAVDLAESFDLDESEISLYSGDGWAQEQRQLSLIVLNTARNLAEDLCNHTSCMLVVDECHRAGSPENARALSGRHSASLGLSATPERPSDEGLDKELIPQLGRIIFTYDYEQALDDQVIVPFDLVNVEVGLSEEEARLYDEISKRLADSDGPSSEVTQKLIRRKSAISANSPVRIPWAVKLTLRHPSERVLIFHERVDAAEMIIRLLARHKVTSLAYHSKLSPSHRRDNLRLFRRGVERVLVTCRALDEGANIPETTVGIVASSTSSLRQRIQRLGRVLRPAPDKEGAVIYTLFAGDGERTRLASEALEMSEIASISWKSGAVR